MWLVPPALCVAVHSPVTLGIDPLALFKTQSSEFCRLRSDHIGMRDSNVPAGKITVVGQSIDCTRMRSILTDKIT
jgi:hypothetical protein